MSTSSPCRRVASRALATLVLAATTCPGASFAPAALAARPAASGPPLVATNNRVAALARLGDTLYLGGTFTLAGPNTGGLVAIDRATGRLAPGLPRVAGAVKAMVEDGSGGWFLGGSFVGVSGVARAGLAHVLADGSLDDWGPAVDGDVEALAFAGGAVYVGGSFAHIGGVARSNLAAVDARSGEVTAWDPGANSSVYAMLAEGAALIVGGGFTQIDGTPRLSVAEFSVRTGRLADWDPQVGIAGGPGRVQAMARSGNTLYLGGRFFDVGGVPRRNAAAVSLVTGKATAWDPDVWDCNCYDYAGSAYVTQVLPAGGGTVYIGGYFSLVHGLDRGGVAEVDAATGVPTAWDPHVGPRFLTYAPVTHSLALGPHTLFIGMDGDAVGGAARVGLAEVDRRTGVATSWNPVASASPSVLVARGGRIYAGGPFSTVNAQRRQGLAAMDLRTGELTDWAPTYDGWVEELAAADGRVYVGGHFGRIDGADRLCLAALDPVTGAGLDFRADADGVVRRLALAGDRLYLGGDFAHVNGADRLHVAAVDRVTGQLAAWNPTADDAVTSIVPDGPTIWLAGSFRKVGGVQHPGVAAVDAVTGDARDWGSFSTNDYVEAIGVGPHTVDVAGMFKVSYDQSRNGLLVLDKATAAPPGLFTSFAIPNTSGPYVRDMARDGDVLYVGGDFREIGGAKRAGLMAMDANRGALLDWSAPLGGREYGGLIDAPIVWRLLVDGPRVFAGGDFATIGAEPAGNVAVLPGAGGVAPSPVVDASARSRGELALTIEPSPVRGPTTMRFGLARASVASLSVFDARGRRIATALDRAALSAGSHSFTVDTAGWRAGIYFARLDVDGDPVLARKFIVLD